MSSLKYHMCGSGLLLTRKYRCFHLSFVALSRPSFTSSFPALDL